MAPLRVMHIVYRLQPGGMEYGVVKLVNRMDRARVASSICSCCPAADALKATLRPDVPVFEFNRRPGNDVTIVASLVRLFRRQRPDVVHTHAWGTLCEGLLAARLAGVPFVVHGEHGTMETRARNVRVQRWVWHRVDQVLSVSSRLAERMARDVGFPHERIRTIRNGVDIDRFDPARRAEARAALDLRPDEVVIGTVGRLVPVKDHASLLEAAALLVAQGLAVTIMIVGDGPLRSDLEARAGALGLTPSLRLPGYRPDIELALAGFDIFVLPSRSEGLSNTIQEAMASGLPVVATRVGGADELVVDGVTGILVPRESSALLAEALARLVTDPARRAAMGAAGRRRAETEFSLPKMVRAYEDVYWGLVERRLGLSQAV